MPVAGVAFFLGGDEGGANGAAVAQLRHGRFLPRRLNRRTRCATERSAQLGFDATGNKKGARGA
jgi:hypothetical protein